MEQDRDAVVNKILIKHYGPKNEWTTDHLAHYHYYLMLLAFELNEQIVSPAIKKIKGIDKQSRSRSDLATELLEQAKLIISDLKSENEAADALLSQLEQKAYLAKLVIDDAQEYNEQLVQDFAPYRDDIRGWINKRKGRPSRGTAKYELLDYLSPELGSINKAVNYIIESPILNGKNADTLRREYRKYRKVKEGETPLKLF